MKLTKRLNQIVKHSFLLILLITVKAGNAQSISLESCHSKAEDLSPIKRQEAYLQSIQDLNQEIETNKFLPDLTLKGSASYQSDVFSLPFEMPGASIPQIPKDQYQASLNLTQNIYSGGMIKASQQLKSSESEVSQAQLEVSLYQIHSIINELYFGVLEIQNNEQILNELLSELNNRKQSIQSGIRNGILLPSALKMIQKEQLTAQQSLNGLKLRKSTLLKVLGDWIGEEIPPSSTLTTPDIDNANQLEIQRPELNLFSTKSNQIEASKNILQSAARPKLLAFANLGYGNPNPLNLFETDWSTFYMFGGRLEWKFWDWNSTNKQKQVLRLNQEIVQSEQDNFIRTIDNQLIQQETEVTILKESIRTDEQLVALQKDITETASAQLEEGTISATDYITELNNLTQSKLKLASDQIKLSKAIATQLTISGNM